MFWRIFFLNEFPLQSAINNSISSIEQKPKESGLENIPMHRPAFTTQMPVSLYSFSPKTISGVNKICMYQHAVNNNDINFVFCIARSLVTLFLTNKGTENK
jgi:hypothetical protein